MLKKLSKKNKPTFKCLLRHNESDFPIKTYVNFARNDTSYRFLFANPNSLLAEVYSMVGFADIAPNSWPVHFRVHT